MKLAENLKKKKKENKEKYPPPEMSSVKQGVWSSSCNPLTQTFRKYSIIFDGRTECPLLIVLMFLYYASRSSINKNF